MAVSYVGTGGVQTGTTTLTITGFASGLEATDILIMWAFHKSTSSIGDLAGWTTLTTQASTSGSLSVYWKVAGATSASNQVIDSLVSSSIGSMAAFRGVDNTTPFVASSASLNYKSQANAEGTYEVPSTGANWSNAGWTDGMGVSIMALDNDVSTFGFGGWYSSTAGTDASQTSIASGSTTNGTDCAGRSTAVTYATYNLSDPLAGFFYSTITEGSAGTASNACIMFVLKAAAGSTPITGTDTGAGADTSGSSIGLSGGGETASGAEAGSVAATLSGADTGTGAEASSIGQTRADTGSGADAASSIGLSGTDVGSGADAGSVTAALTGTDTGSGTDAAGTIGLTASDTGTSVEATSVQVAPTGSDTGSGADAAVSIGLSASDTGTGADTGSVAATLSASDTGSAAEAATVSLVVSDTGAGVDAGSVAATLTVQDTGSGVDAAVSVGLSASDTGAGVDSGSVDIGAGTPISGSDTGSGADTGSVTASITGTDTGTGIETGSVAASLTATDTATGTEATSIGLTGSETGSAQDTGSVAASLAASDTGASAEAGSTTASLTGTDTGASTETASTTAQVTASDTATSVDAGSVTVGSADVQVSATDTARAVESASVVVTLSVSETVLSADAGTIGLTTADTGSGVDARTLQAQPVGTDTATGVDIKSVLTSSQTVADTASFLDTGVALRQVFVLVPPSLPEHFIPPQNAVDRVGHPLDLTVYRIAGVWRSGRNVKAAVLAQADLVYRGGYEHIIDDQALRAELTSAGYTFETRYV